MIQPNQRNARPRQERRAFSLLELAAVVAILGLMAGVVASRWGDATLGAASAQGLSRSLQLSLCLARRQAICEGTSAAVVFTRDGGAVASFHVVRAASGGDQRTDETIDVADDLTVTAPADRWQFDYTGILAAPAAGGVIQVADGVGTWSLTVNAATGSVRLVKAS